MPVSKEDAIKEANSMIDLAVAEARKKIEKAINSGGIDLSKTDNDVLVGKIIAKAVMTEGVREWITLSSKHERQVKNLINLIWYNIKCILGI